MKKTIRPTTALLIIDAQHDFCHPEGALYVAGADGDVKRIKRLIENNLTSIDHITVTLDTHHILDVSHPMFWRDDAGNPPAPFTQITHQEILNGKWMPIIEPEKVTTYVQALENQGQFPHFIWPEHCLIGSKGAGLDDHVMNALRTWTHYTQRDYDVAVKGTNRLTEHFGIFRANIPIDDAPETQFNQALVQLLMQYDQVLLMGEAKSHCVGTSLKQAMDFAPELAQKMIVVEDCMSDVAGLVFLGEPIYAEAKQRGIRFVKAEEITWG
ncbi:MAG: nicotinamidase [Spirosomataceae bacterium]